MEDEAAAEKRVIAVAVKKNSNSKYAITWALDQFMTHGHSLFLIHIRKRLRTIPTPLGSQVPIESVSDEAVAAYRSELDGRVDELLLPYVRLCKSKKVEAKLIIKEDDDEAAAIVKEISNRGIQHLVMGASSRGIFGRFKGLDTPGTVSQNAPLFCSVYVISKGRLTSVRSASGITKIRQDDDSSRSSSSSKMVHESSAARSSTDTNNLEMDSQEYYSEPEMLRITDTKKDINQAMTCRSAIQGYRKYTFEEIQQATDCFSESLKIGEGGYGAVYKGYLQHTMVAIKVLRDEAAHGIKQFHKEVEVLSQIRHPHMVMLMGACAEHGCLVYEYTANGSLDERLQRKGNSKALPWQARFRVAWEIASALNFLHTAKPKPIVHRDLKPGNILLDANNVSKIGDVGLARLAPSLSTTTIMTTEFKTTVPAGTFCYIDPEYQRTGMFSPKSDLYAFGIIVLQLITAKAPMALTYHVETAIEDNEFEDILDKSAGEWPVQETLRLANMALKCAEFRRRDRPDLEYDVLPLLSTLHAMALHSSSSSSSSNPSTAFLCPISNEVMEDPQVAADGFTYEYNSIKTWLDRNNTSPMTYLTMPHKNLIPNLTLRSAILEWKSKISN